jgi:hypothetical protein
MLGPSVCARLDEANGQSTKHTHFPRGFVNIPNPNNHRLVVRELSGSQIADCRYFIVSAASAAIAVEAIE